MKRKISSSSADIEEELLCCNICFDRFAEGGDQSPRILSSCGHTYCLKCVTKISGSRKQLECPSCRLVTKFGRGSGPTSLVINSHVVRRLEMNESSTGPSVRVRSRQDIIATACTAHDNESMLSSVICMNCEEAAPAGWGCVECSDLLCDGCKTAHSNSTLRVIRNHRILCLEDFRKHRVCMCTKHSNEEITRVCDDCGVLVCATGASLHHSGHITSSLVDGVMRERSKLEQSLQAAQKLVDTVQPKMEVVQHRMTHNRENTTKLHEQVETDRARMIQVIEKINSRAAAAHEEIESRSGASLRCLEAEKQGADEGLAYSG